LTKNKPKHKTFKPKQPNT